MNGKLEKLVGESWWQDALALYKEQADDLHAGRIPRSKSDNPVLADLCNRFLTAKLRSKEAGEISGPTFDGYKGTTDLLVETFGRDRQLDDLESGDFAALRNKMAQRWGPVRLGNEIGKVRTVFKYGYEDGLIDRPIRFGPEFKKPSASVLRRHKASTGEKMIEADELRHALDIADVQLKAMLLLGVNCGLGNHDIALLPLSALDLDVGWLDFPRPKTGIARRCSLWPETVLALQKVLDVRPTPKAEDAKLRVFVTVRGRAWLSRGVANPVSVAARKLMKSAGIHRQGIGFYTLRHVFRTVADGTRDQVAINLIMGHADASMAAAYRERIDDTRLRIVADYVRAWLFCDDVPKQDKPGNDPAEPKDAPPLQPIEPLSADDRPRLRIFG